MGEFIRTLVMQILNHSTHHRQSLMKTTTSNNSDVLDQSNSNILSLNSEPVNPLDKAISIMPSAPPMEEDSENLLRIDRNDFNDKSEQRIHKTMERIHENEQYNDLLKENEISNIASNDETRTRPPPRGVNTNPFLPNFGKPEKEAKLYENHENLFLRNQSQNHKDLKSSRLHRQQSEPPLTDKKSIRLQKSLSTDSKNSNNSNVENSHSQLINKNDKNLIDLGSDVSNLSIENEESKDSRDGNFDMKQNDRSDVTNFKSPLSPGGNASKVSRIPVANFKYPNMSGLSSAENSPSKLSNRSQKDNQRSSASDNSASENKESSTKNKSDTKLSSIVNEVKKSEPTDPKLSDELPEYQNVLKPPSCPKKLSPKMGRPGEHPLAHLISNDSVLNSPDYDMNIDYTKSFGGESLPISEQKQLDSTSTKLINNNNEDVPPPIPSLPVNPRTLIANFYYEKLLSEPEIQQSLLPHNLEKNPDDCFKKALLFPLLEIDPPKQCLFLLVDSIDETPLISSGSNSTLTREREKSGSDSGNSTRNANSSKTIAELLANHHHLFPQWLLLVCTARKQSKYLTKMFTGNLIII